jgi:hypothetical protein
MQSEGDNIRVAQTRGGFRDIKHVMTAGAQKSNQRRRDAFVGEPAQVLPVNDVFVGEIIGGKSLRGPDVVMCQPRVIHEDRFGRHTGAEFAQN